MEKNCFYFFCRIPVKNTASDEGFVILMHLLIQKSEASKSTSDLYLLAYNFRFLDPYFSATSNDFQ